uniref:Uncharacterized protein n=1 Tax=Sinocyclocheilus rhinocerous TaxID=307959 RepID=A0A673KPP3_9TELE
IVESQSCEKQNMSPDLWLLFEIKLLNASMLKIFIIYTSYFVRLNDCNLTYKGCALKALSLNPSHLRELHLSWNDIGDSGVTHLCSALEKVHCALETLKLDKCGITEKGCSALASALSSKTCCLTDLDLSINDLQDSGVKKLCVGLKNPHCTLEKLRSHYDFKTLLYVFNQTYKSIVRRSRGSDVCKPDLDFIVLPTAGLEDTKCRLESLNLKNCGVTEAGCDFLSSALSLNPSHLRELHLSWNNIGDSGVKHLCAALEKVHCIYYSFKVILCTIICIIKNFTFLTCYRLSTCKIKTEGFGSLASVLRSNSHLRELDLGNNRPGDQGAELLSAVLQHPNCRLKTLRLDKCGITEKGCTALASALSSKTCCLTDLDLSINDLQDSGVKKLCIGLKNPHCTLEKLR